MKLIICWYHFNDIQTENQPKRKLCTVSHVSPTSATRKRGAAAGPGRCHSHSDSRRYKVHSAMMTMCHGIKKSKCELGMTRGKTDMILLEKKKKKTIGTSFILRLPLNWGRKSPWQFQMYRLLTYPFKMSFNQLCTVWTFLRFHFTPSLSPSSPPPSRRNTDAWTVSEGEGREALSMHIWDGMQLSW